jgi:hypothetical protein
MPDPILNRVLELLGTPEQWTKHAHARNADNLDVSPFNPDVECYCIDGALLRASAEAAGKLDEYRKLESDVAIDEASGLSGYHTAGCKLHDLLPHTGYVEFNDDAETTYADVRSVIQKAANA